MADPLTEAREELATLIDIQFVIGEVRVTGKEAHKATKALDYLEGKLKAAEAKVAELTPIIPPEPEVVRTVVPAPEAV